MSNNDLFQNPSPRCACMLVLDTSGSMSGAPIQELNQGLQAFVEAVQEDEMSAYSVEVGVISAGGTVREELSFTTANAIREVSPLVADGITPLGAAVELALRRLEERKAAYKRAGVAYYQPWLVIISDGEPTDSWQAVAQQTSALSQQRKLVVMPVGVQQANMATLGQFSSRPAKHLAGLKFREFFEWLSASMSRVSASNSTSSAVALPKTDSWDAV